MSKTDKLPKLYRQTSPQARHYLDQRARPLPEIVYGYAMTEKQHRERTVRGLAEVTCEECVKKLLSRGIPVAGRRAQRSFFNE